MNKVKSRHKETGKRILQRSNIFAGERIKLQTDGFTLDEKVAKKRFNIYGDNNYVGIIKTKEGTTLIIMNDYYICFKNGIYTGELNKSINEGGEEMTELTRITRQVQRETSGLVDGEMVTKKVLDMGGRERIRSKIVMVKLQISHGIIYRLNLIFYKRSRNVIKYIIDEIEKERIKFEELNITDAISLKTWQRIREYEIMFKNMLASINNGINAGQEFINAIKI